MHNAVAAAGSELNTWGLVRPLLPVLALALVVALAYNVLSHGKVGYRKRSFVSTSLRVRLRWYPGPGYATRWDLWFHYGLHRAREVAKHGRKSLTWWDRQFGPREEYATFLGRAQGWLHRWRVYTSFETIMLYFAPPQEGKSSEAGWQVLDAPGACAVTSIRGDLIAETAGARERHGVVWIWNPEGIGQFGSNMRWNPVAGCQDIIVAARRARNMVAAQSNEGLADSAFWTDQAAQALTAVMHAAGLVGGSMANVFSWIMERSDEPSYILDAHPGADQRARAVIRNFETMPDRTRDGVITTLSRVLQFMANPNVVTMLSPQAGEGFNFEQFVQSKDTLYLTSAIAQGSPVAPLFTAFLCEMVETATLLSSMQGAHGKTRLDPPLTLVLDELANIAPVPVDAWASFAAGSGIRIFMYVQSWAQLVRRFGTHGARALWACAKGKVITSATSETDLQRMVSELAGDVHVREPYDDVHYGQSGRQARRPRHADVKVINAAAIRRLPKGCANVIVGSAPPTVVRLPNVRKHPRYLAWKKGGGRMPVVNLPVREIPKVMPELARRPEPQPQAVLPPDELQRRRAQRQPHQAPPLFPGQEQTGTDFHGTPPASWGRATQPPQQALNAPSWYRPADPNFQPAPAQHPTGPAPQPLAGPERGRAASYGPAAGRPGGPAPAGEERWSWWPQTETEP